MVKKRYDHRLLHQLREIGRDNRRLLHNARQQRIRIRRVEPAGLADMFCYAVVKVGCQKILERA